MALLGEAGEDPPPQEQANSSNAPARTAKTRLRNSLPSSRNIAGKPSSGNHNAKSACGRRAEAESCPWVMVKVAAAVPVPGLTEAGANAQLAPAGKLEQASETAPTLPAVAVTVT